MNATPKAGSLRAANDPAKVLFVLRDSDLELLRRCDQRRVT